MAHRGRIGVLRDELCKVSVDLARRKEPKRPYGQNAKEEMQVFRDNIAKLVERKKEFDEKVKEHREELTEYRRNTRLRLQREGRKQVIEKEMQVCVRTISSCTVKITNLEKQVERQRANTARQRRKEVQEAAGTPPTPTPTSTPVLSLNRSTEYIHSFQEVESELQRLRKEVEKCDNSAIKRRNGLEKQIAVLEGCRAKLLPLHVEKRKKKQKKQNGSQSEVDAATGGGSEGVLGEGEKKDVYTKEEKIGRLQGRLEVHKEKLEKLKEEQARLSQVVAPDLIDGVVQQRQDLQEKIRHTFDMMNNRKAEFAKQMQAWTNWRDSTAELKNKKREITKQLMQLEREQRERERDERAKQLQARQLEDQVQCRMNPHAAEMQCCHALIRSFEKAVGVTSTPQRSRSPGGGGCQQASPIRWRPGDDEPDFLHGTVGEKRAKCREKKQKQTEELSIIPHHRPQKDNHISISLDELQSLSALSISTIPTKKCDLHDLLITLREKLTVFKAAMRPEDECRAEVGKGKLQSM